MHMAKTIQLDQFKNIVAKRRKAASSLNDSQFAESVNLTRQTIQNITSGKHLPTANVLEKFGYELVCREKDAKPVSIKAPAPAAPKKSAAKKRAVK